MIGREEKVSEFIEDDKVMVPDDLGAIRVDFDRPSYPVAIPEGETVVDDDKLERYLKRHLRKEITFRYQSAKPDSGTKWRTLKLVEYDGTHFHCIDSGDADHSFTYRRDRVLEIRD